MNNSEGQTQEPVGGMKSKEEIIIDLKALRNYFGSHDKTMEEHRLYAIADKLLKHFTSAAPPSPVGIDVEQAAANWQKQNENYMPDEQSESMLYDSFMAGVEWKSASLPQSSTEEEKEIKEDRVYSKEELRDMAERFGGFEIP